MKQFFMLAMAAAVAVGCSKQDSMDTVQEPGTIRLFMGVEAPASKAVVTPATGATAVNFLKIDAAAAPADFSGALAGVKQGDVAATTGEVSFASKFGYNQNDSKAWMVAYYPAGTSASGKITWTIDGHTDVMRTNAVWDAGQYSVPLTGAEAGGTKMVLNHCLSRVEVVCEAEASSSLAAVQAAWGNIEKIEFVNAPTEVVYNLADLSVANGATAADFSLLKDYVGTAFTSIAMPVNGAAVVNACAMLAPIAVAENVSFKLKVTTAGAVAETLVPITSLINVQLTNSATATAMEKAKIHKVTLTFKADGKDIAIKSSTIEDWVDGPSASNSLDKPTS